MAENKKFIINKNAIEVELTLRCNLHCANCDRMAPKPLDIKLDDFKNFLALDRKWSSIRLIGGEPLLYPHIEEVFKILENYKDKCLIGLSTNGYNKELLKKIPPWVSVGNSNKKSSEQLFRTFNVAPIDVGIESGFENGCDIPQRCGMCLSVDGLFYCCGAGATVSRELKLQLSQTSIDSVGEWMFSTLCRYCGHFKYYNSENMDNRSTKQETSKSWLKK
jgi:4Fe-4S single cluster domain